MCGFSAVAQVRDAGLADQEGPARVDVLHQVVTLHLQRLGAGEVDRRRVVDAHVDPAEPLDRLGHGGDDLLLVADVADDRQRPAARRLDLLGRRVDGALELGMGLGGLGDQRDVRAVPGRPQRDGQPDAATGAGDEQGLVGEGCRHGASLAPCHRLPGWLGVSSLAGQTLCAIVFECPCAPPIPSTVLQRPFRSPRARGLRHVPISPIRRASVSKPFVRSARVRS